jgi:hypothetical protein
MIAIASSTLRRISADLSSPCFFAFSRIMERAELVATKVGVSMVFVIFLGAIIPIRQRGFFEL